MRCQVAPCRPPTNHLQSQLEVVRTNAAKSKQDVKEKLNNQKNKYSRILAGLSHEIYSFRLIIDK